MKYVRGGGVFFVKKVENGFFVKKWKVGVFFVKSGKWGCF